MATTTKKVLVLTFGYAADNTKTTQITISKPASGLSDATVKAAADAVVAAGALCKKGEVTAVDMIKEANYVDTTTEEITL